MVGRQSSVQQFHSGGRAKRQPQVRGKKNRFLWATSCCTHGPLPTTHPLSLSLCTTIYPYLPLRRQSTTHRVSDRRIVFQKLQAKQKTKINVPGRFATGKPITRTPISTTIILMIIILIIIIDWCRLMADGGGQPSTLVTCWSGR